MNTLSGSILLSISLCGLALDARAAERPFTPQDVLNLEQIGGFTGGGIEFSGDGRALAVVRQRPQVYKDWRYLVWDERRADIAVGSPEGGLTTVTDGATTGSGYWAPTWSPDNSRLALLSSRGDAQHLWVWTRASGKLTELTTFDVARGTGGRTFFWLDNHRILLVRAADSEDAGGASWASLRGTPRVAMSGWPRMWAGKETTASALDSGVPVDISTRPRQQVMIVDVDGGHRAVAAEFGVHALKPAPGGRLFAFMARVAFIPPQANKPVMHSGGRLGAGLAANRYQVVVMDDQGRRLATQAAGAYAVPTSFVWSADGKQFAFIGVTSGDEDGQFSVFKGQVSGASARVDELPMKGLDPQAVLFARDNRLLMSARADTAKEPRTDWWTLAASGPQRNLTASLKKPPAALFPSASTATAVAVSEGEVWQLDFRSGRWTSLTQAIEPKLDAVVWPGDGGPRNAGGDPNSVKGYSRLIVSTGEAWPVNYFRVNIDAGTVTPLARPSDAAKLTQYCAATDTALFVADERTGSVLTAVTDAKSSTLLETNAFLKDIGEGERRLIEYRGLDGQGLKALAVLPPDYQPGRKYPVIVSVYAGSMVKNVNAGLSTINSAHPQNMQLFAARGYVVLRPSMPLSPEPDGKKQPGSDPLLDLTKGVLPALDKLIDLGIADPNRLAVTGQSYGGFSTYGLITQTNRFKAALVTAGLSDLISLYGGFVADERYGPNPQEMTFRMSIAETAQSRMGNPPWKDWSRYLRNSPLFYVDRVQTPLMIVQGDLDYVAMQQGEEFFNALYRQGKRARFVRYWGEGHIVESPANVVDFWQQINAWFDEQLDVARDGQGTLAFDGERVKSRQAPKPD